MLWPLPPKTLSASCYMSSIKSKCIAKQFGLKLCNISLIHRMAEKHVCRHLHYGWQIATHTQLDSVHWKYYYGRNLEEYLPTSNDRTTINVNIALARSWLTRIDTIKTDRLCRWLHLLYSSQTQPRVPSFHTYPRGVSLLCHYLFIHVAAII